MLVTKLGRALAGFALLTGALVGTLGTFNTFGLLSALGTDSAPAPTAPARAGARVAVAPEAREAPEPPSDPSIRDVRLRCGGARASVSVRWWDSDVVSVDYTVRDRDRSDGRTPKVRFTAHDTSRGQSYELDTDGRKAGRWKVMPAAADVHSGSLAPWNPSGVGHVLYLAVTLENGLDGEPGTTCTTSKRIWNWGANALRTAQLQEGTPYGPACEPYAVVDSSCLVRWSFSELPGFGSFERGSRSQEAWLEDLASDGRRTRVDAIRVSLAEVQRGDLVFSAFDSGPGADHVSFYWSEGYVYGARDLNSPAGLHAQELRPAEVAAVYRITGVS